MPHNVPTISIVTPSFNRREYLTETMDSVLGQGYPELEYVVVDGGSTDGSAELIANRAEELAWWVSEPDSGAWEAINKGFAHTSGEIMGWLGSDDMLMPWTLSIVGELFAAFPGLEWLTTRYPSECDDQGRMVTSYPLDVYSTKAFFKGANLPFAGWPAAGFIEQEATFWRRSLWERAGGRLDESLRLAADFELWARFHRAGGELFPVAVPLATFRRHGNQKSQTDFEGYIEEARDVLFRYGGRPPTFGTLINRAVRAIALRVVPKPVRIRVGSMLLTMVGLPPTLLHGQPCFVHEGLDGGWRLEGSGGDEVRLHQVKAPARGSRAAAELSRD